MGTNGNRDSRTVERGSISKPVAIAIAVATLSVLLAAGWAWWDGRERRAVLALAPAVRADVYSRNLQDMRDLCGAAATSGATSTATSAVPPSGLDARCAERAEFLTLFPECNDDCHALLERHLPKPTR